MTRAFTPVSIFCLTCSLLGFSVRAFAIENNEMANCFQKVAKAEKSHSKIENREAAFYQLAEKYGIISDENTVSDANKPAYFKLMQVYSDNLVSPPDLFCKALTSVALQAKDGNISPIPRSNKSDAV